MVPSYRGGAFLKEALDSVAAQTFPWRLVLLDTSGEGRAQSILAKMPVGFRRKTQFEHFPPHDDAGCAAHEHLRELWGGDGVACWLHDDDIFHPDRLKDSVQYLAAYPECDAAFCGLVPIGMTTKTDALWAGLAYSEQAQYARPEVWGWTRSSYHKPVATPAVMMRPRVINIERPLQYVAGAEDVLIHARWWAAGLTIRTVPNTPHYLWRSHKGEMANSCTAIKVESDMGYSRLAPNQLYKEVAEHEAEIDTMRRDMTLLNAEYDAPVWWVAPRTYDIAGIGRLTIHETRDLVKLPIVDKSAPVLVPLAYPVKLSKSVTFEGRAYPQGARVDRATTVGMKMAGLLTDPRII
jgi:hypothetical protein